MSNKKLLCIEDENNHKLFYYFTPASLLSNFTPLIIVLDSQERNFDYKMWNMLTPIGDFTHQNSWTSNLLQRLVEEISQEYECENDIYLYGSYNALLYAILFRTNAVYADISSMPTNPSICDDINNALKMADSHLTLYLYCNQDDQSFPTIFQQDATKATINFLPKLNEHGYTIENILNIFERMPKL